MAKPDPIEAQLISLQTSVIQIADATIDLADRQAKQINRTRRLLSLVVIGLILDLSLTVFAGVLYYRVDQIQTRTSTQALCPLYTVFLQSYAPTSPEAKKDPAKYENAFVVIEKGAKALGCSKTTRGV